jgi:hypothetical protein
MVFFVRASSAGQLSLDAKNTVLKAFSGRLRERWESRYGLITAESMDLLVIQSALQPLRPKYLKELRLFLQRNRSCDFVVSGFDGFLLDRDAIKSILSILKDLDLGLIIYRAEKDKFYRIDIHIVIAVQSGLAHPHTLDPASQHFFTQFQQGAKIRKQLSRINKKRVRLFPFRNTLRRKAIQPVVDDFQQCRCPVCLADFT